MPKDLQRAGAGGGGLCCLPALSADASAGSGSPRGWDAAGRRWTDFLIMPFT